MGDYLLAFIGIAYYGTVYFWPLWLWAIGSAFFLGLVARGVIEGREARLGRRPLGRVRRSSMSAMAAWARKQPAHAVVVTGVVPVVQLLWIRYADGYIGYWMLAFVILSFIGFVLFGCGVALAAGRLRGGSAAFWRTFVLVAMGTVGLQVVVLPLLDGRPQSAILCLMLVHLLVGAALVAHGVGRLPRRASGVGRRVEA